MIEDHKTVPLREINMLDFRNKPDRPLVAPSMLASDFGRLAEEASDVLNLGADLLHIDIMDGHFAANLALSPDAVKALRRALPQVFLDCHLMVEHPEMFVEPFAKAGANHFSFHLEVTHPFHPAGVEVDPMIKRIHDAGMTAGMVINPYTEPQLLERYWDQLQLVLVMSVVPGFGGQSFITSVLEKTAWLSERLPDHCRLEMDGGLDLATTPGAVEAGVDVIVAGSSIFKAEDRGLVIEAMQHLTLRERG